MRSASVIAASAFLAGALLAGCASPGNPRPPSLNLPDKVTDLTASRIGDRVKISWSPPTRTTDGVDIEFPVTVEICRDPVLPPPSTRSRKPIPIPCTSVKRLTGHTGPSTAEDTLPASLTTGPRLAVAYRLRLLNPAGRSAAASTPVYVASGPAEPAVASFHATQTRPGVVLEWAPTPPESAVEVTRTLIQPPAPAPAPKPQGKALPVGKKKDPAAPVLLRPATPAHGMLDPVPLISQTYTYTAQRISNVELAGHPLQLRSEPTPALTLALRDTFPPVSPRGLVSVPGTLANQPTLDLSWDPNPEPDLAGYRVYRLDLAGPTSTPRLLTPELLAGPAFRDPGVLPNHRYRYQVTAVDRTGNESSPSTSIEDAP
jgi:hypothetical protein